MRGEQAAPDMQLHLDPHQNGLQQPPPGRPPPFRNRQRRRDHGAGRVNQRRHMHVVEIQHVGCEPVDEGGGSHVEAAVAADDGGGADGRADDAEEAGDGTITAAADRTGEPVGDGADRVEFWSGFMAENELHDPAGH
jgi:hypothetical protein